MITAKDVQKLREMTSAGMMDCKKALEDANGDFEKALELVAQKGMAKAEKKSDRETKEGYIGCYVHATGKVAGIVELLCETDFVARNEEFRSLAKDLAMQVTAMSPANKEELLDQEMLKNSDQKVADAIKQVSGKVGENIVLGEFSRFEI